jgi:hypothetical protein
MDAVDLINQIPLEKDLIHHVPTKEKTLFGKEKY